jgi:hypothetical protein
MDESTTKEAPGVSRALIALWLFWGLLAVRVVVALVRHESFRDDLALPTLAFFVSTAVLGSRLWGKLLDRADVARRS